MFKKTDRNFHPSIAPPWVDRSSRERCHSTGNFVLSGIPSRNFRLWPRGCRGGRKTSRSRGSRRSMKADGNSDAAAKSGVLVLWRELSKLCKFRSDFSNILVIENVQKNGSKFSPLHKSTLGGPIESREVSFDGE